MRAGAPDRIVVANRLATLKFNLVYGPVLTDVLTRCTGYTGRPPLSPRWAFRPWISSDIWRSGGEVRYAVTQFRDRGIPASALVLRRRSTLTLSQRQLRSDAPPQRIASDRSAAQIKVPTTNVTSRCSFGV
jgi:hypothetical protein